LAEAFFAESKLPGEFKWHHWYNTWSDLMAKDIGAIFCYFLDGRPVGVIGGLQFNCFNTGDHEIIEAFWYLLPNCRVGMAGIRLLDRFEEWGRQVGAVRCKMAHLEDVNPAIVADMYRRRGYVKQETTYRKEL
jgi:hypothetical protein